MFAKPNPSVVCRPTIMTLLQFVLQYSIGPNLIFCNVPLVVWCDGSTWNRLQLVVYSSSVEGVCSSRRLLFVLYINLSKLFAVARISRTQANTCKIVICTIIRWYCCQCLLLSKQNSDNEFIIICSLSAIYKRC
jgi:hypothetical protein